MKKYGIRIGNTGVEFPSIEERQKAVLTFTKGCDVVISDNGVRFKDGMGSFSVYDRDTKETLTNCEVCLGVFGIDTCSLTNYPIKHSWEKTYSEHSGYLCEGCLAKAVEKKKIYDAKILLEKREE